MKIVFKLLKAALKNGKPVGYSGNLTEVTGYLKNHSKGIGEEVGNILGGKAKNINNKLLKNDVYDKFFNHIDEVAKEYPDATIKVAAKKSKKGHFQLANIEVKNGDKTIIKQAASVCDDGTLKLRGKILNSEMSQVIDKQGVRATATSDKGTVKTIFDKAKKTGQVELRYGDEQVAVANYVNKGGNVSRAGVTCEKADGLVTGQAYYKGHEVSFIGDEKGIKDWAKRAKKQDDDLSPLTIKLLRPLKERFNDVIDAFKYNKNKDFERLISKDELHKSVKNLQKEIKNFEDIKNIKSINTDYYNQLQDDLKYVKEILITI
ncbi:hypothetical protein J6R97_07275 [bacterium]|nr:hypothetical protein [bacterium]